MTERDCWELCSDWTDSLHSTSSGGKSTAALQVSTPVWEQSPIVKAGREREKERNGREKQILSHGGFKCFQINNMSAQIVLEKMRRLKFCYCTTFCSLLGITPVHLEASRLMLSVPVIFNPWTAWTTPNPNWPTATFTSQVDQSVHAKVPRIISSISHSVIYGFLCFFIMSWCQSALRGSLMLWIAFS